VNFIEEWVKLLTDFRSKIGKEIIYGGIGKIESFDKQKMRADVQPLLFQTSKGSRINNAIIPQVPVQFLFSGGFYIRPDYKKGDLVWLGYATFAIENQLKGHYEATNGATNHEHTLSVMNGVAMSGWNSPPEFSKAGLLLGHKDSGLWLQITDTEINGKGTKFNWEGDVNVTGKIKATQNIETDADVKALGKVKATKNLETDMDVVWLASATPTHGISHMHPTAAPGSPSPATPGS
jgi:hypothetical protein